MFVVFLRFWLWLAITSLYFCEFTYFWYQIVAHSKCFLMVFYDKPHLQSRPSCEDITTIPSIFPSFGICEDTNMVPDIFQMAITCFLHSLWLKILALNNSLLLSKVPKWRWAETMFTVYLRFWLWLDITSLYFCEFTYIWYQIVAHSKCFLMILNKPLLWGCSKWRWAETMFAVYSRFLIWLSIPSLYFCEFTYFWYQIVAHSKCFLMILDKPLLLCFSMAS